MKLPYVFTPAQRVIPEGLRKRDLREREAGIREAMPEKTALAVANLEAAGLRHRASLVTAEGLEFVASLPTAIDFVLVDYGVGDSSP